MNNKSLKDLNKVLTPMKKTEGKARQHDTQSTVVVVVCVGFVCVVVVVCVWWWW